MELQPSIVNLSISFIKEIVTILSLSIASIIAILGLFLWKRQLRGTQSYELAKRILKTVYHIRNLLLLSRYPTTDSEEINASKILEEKYKNEINEIFYDGCIFREVQEYRWQKFLEELDNLEIDACEAEALWGEEKRATIMSIKEIALSFRSAIEEYIVLIFSGINQEIIHEDFKNLMNVAFCNPAHPNDEFDQNVNITVDVITRTLRPYLSK